MRIRNIILHNFGIYASTNNIDLANKKPVVLIGGMNGRGKTTLLEAILLALYGNRSFAFVESKLSFPNYLTRLVNKADGSLRSHVELIFELISGDEIDCYSVRREWSLCTITPAFNTVVHKNQSYDQVLSENWDLFVEEILPNAIAPFFFFDGEKISELANSDNDEQIKVSIRNLLGINVIDQAIADLRKIITSKKHLAKTNTYDKDIAAFEAQIKKVETEAKKASDHVADLEVKKSRLTDRLQKAEGAFAAMGGIFALNRKELLAKQSSLQEQLNEIDAQILELVSGDIPLLLTLPLLKDILCVAESEREEKAIRTALEKLPILYKEFSEGKRHDIGFSDFMNFIKKSSKDTQIIYNLTENGFFQIKALCSMLLNHQRESLNQIYKQRQELLEEIVKNENYLSLNVDDSMVNSKYKEIIEVTKELTAVIEQQRIAQELLVQKHAASEELKQQQLKVIEKAVSNIEDNIDTKRVIVYAAYSLRVLEEYILRLQKAKTQRLANTMTTCFKQLISKHNLIGEIQINAETLDFVYLDTEGKTIPRSSFSAGEKQLLVIAMLWALGICSKKRFPIIVDTPLARLDNSHREMLLVNYFPKASEQTILLSTDSEIYGKYYDLLSPYIEKKYTLIYKDESKQTIVQEGYFGVNQNDCTTN